MTEKCVICAGRLTEGEVQTCTACVDLVRAGLVSIVRLYQMLPALLGKPDGALLGSVLGGLTDEVPLPGGNALVMLSGGAAAGEVQFDDPPAVLFLLTEWALAWAEIRRERLQPSGLPLLVEWLKTRLSWAMRYHSGAEFAAAVAHIVGWLAAVTGTSDRPETGAPCFECGAALERGWTRRGRDDDYHCPKCHRVYDEVSYRLAVRAQYEEFTSGARARTVSPRFGVP